MKTVPVNFIESLGLNFPPNIKNGYFYSFINGIKVYYTFESIEMAINIHFPKLRHKHIFDQLDGLGILEVFQAGETPCSLPYTFTSNNEEE